MVANCSTSGSGNHAAVGHDEHAVVTDIGPAGVGHEAAADQMVRARGLDHAEQGTEERAGRGIHATDHAVSPAVLDHHGRVVVGLSSSSRASEKPSFL
jgi:hypothetical protein